MNHYPWQQPQWQAVTKSFQQQRYPHALLCYGPSGLGKTAFAKHLASVVLCDASHAKACGTCRNCRLFLAGNHPDFYPVGLLEKSKSIKVEQIRELVVHLAQTAQYDGFQVALIQPAECMNRASSNALLKTLEEPAGKVIFILVADQLTSLPATIMSRCQMLRFTYPSLDEVVPWVQQQLNLAEDKARLLLQLAGGAPLKALTLGGDDHQQLRRLVLKGLWQVLTQEATVCEFAQQLLKKDLSKALAVMFSFIFDVFRVSLTVPETVVQNQDCIKQLRMIKDKVNLTALAQWTPYFLQMQHRLQALPGINVQLVLEGLLLRWQQLGELSCSSIRIVI